jgi:hypothetical protein
VKKIETDWASQNGGLKFQARLYSKQMVTMCEMTTTPNTIEFTQLKTVDYSDFEFHIVATIAEFINDIEQHSYEKLTPEWWNVCYNNTVQMLEKEDVILADVTRKILDSVKQELKSDLLTQAKCAELSEQLHMAVTAFYTIRNLFECNCGRFLCDGQCGYQDCGLCIDVCRCHKWW